MAATANTSRGRILGKSETVEAPLRALWMLTGNNLQFRGDFGRRVIPCDIDPKEEHPEDRTGFRYPNLLAHISQVRGELVGAALTILRAYHEAGRPAHGKPPKGSFEAWDHLVRGALIWAGMPDPLDTVQRVRDEGDTDRERLETGMEAWRDRYGKDAKTTAQVMRDAGDDQEFRDAMTAFVGCEPAVFSSQRLGKTLQMAMGRIIGKQHFQRCSTDKKRKVREWRVVTIDDASDGLF